MSNNSDLADMTLREHMLLGLAGEWRRVYDHLALQLEREFQGWQQAGNRPETLAASQWRVQQVASFLEYRVSRTLDSLGELHAGYRAFVARYQGASSELERRQHSLAYAAELGQSRRGLRADRRALDRWLDASALRDRYRRKVSEQERLLTFCVHRLNANICFFIGQFTQGRERSASLEAISNNALMERLLTSKLDHRATLAGLSLMSGLLAVSDGEFGEHIEPQLLQYCYRLCNDPAQPVWLQVQALDVITWLDSSAALDIVQERFNRGETGDQIFFRARALKVLTTVQAQADAQDLFRQACTDTSEHVRQSLVRLLPALERALGQQLIDLLLEQEQCDRVRARVLQVLPVLIESDLCPPAQALARVTAELTPDGPGLVARAAFEVLVVLGRAGALSGAQLTEVAGMLTRLNLQHQDTAIRRAAAQARERLWAGQHALARWPKFQLLEGLDWQQRSRLRLQHNASDEELGRFFASQAGDSFGYDVRRRGARLRLTSGSRYQFRTWRFLHEFRTSASDKRQNYNHTKGRVFHGHLQAPAWHLAELSQTTVPGEPVHMAEDGDWRPYLPLVDQVLSALDQGWPTRPVDIYTPEGITRIHPPRGLFARLRARSLITLRFARLSRLRNWRSSSAQAPERYLAELEKLGFRFELLGHRDPAGERYQTDPRVRRFFPGLASIAPLPVLWSDFKTYFYSVYENNLQHLVIFLGAAAAVFFGRHVYIGRQMKQARATLPLVVGGWGTRGKSGTERLKAAVFNAEGLGVVSKTTGCEAMFLYSPAHGNLREMFLFRPYDKASIWEQVDLVRLASRFRADVFLWECMGLTPRYVQILQEQWMRDDLATITNCYPDHEDIQGPSGIEIPRVMRKFVPKRSKLITTEHNMFPFLRAAAQDKGSAIIKVSDLDAELLPADVLARFPYEEHPSNIALVLRMAEELGLEPDYALKEMADRVVPDLGVLKIYPRVTVDGRHLTFINGMSANERHAALANWRRLRFDQYHPADKPDAWVVTVINNRADRVPRSQVFARMLVDDLSADRHFLIGTNLDGLKAYIDQAWVDRLGNENFAQQSGPALAERLAEYAHQLRVSTSESMLAGRIRAMLSGLGLEPGSDAPDGTDIDALEIYCKEAGLAPEQARSVLAQGRADAQEWLDYRDLQQRLAAGSAGASELEQALTGWFERRIVVLPNSHATGDQSIRDMVNATPPGLDTHMMGMQNIKGTGLDFIYRWQAWDRHYQDGQQLLADDPERALAAARSLAAVEDFGWLDFDYLTPLLTRAAELPGNQTQAIQSELALIRSQLDQCRDRLQRADASKRESSRGERLIDALEAVLDAGAAVRRRKRVGQIYRDLAGQRISHERAALELKQINRSQKGGWLKERLLRGRSGFA
ncbi:hypothetical protein [Marinobacter sp.]|uniref:hypothetical protein n=1 Tax=Marinobacter sp. TaxID=50741 RepID=UPI0035C78399